MPPEHHIQPVVWRQEKYGSRKLPLLKEWQHAETFILELQDAQVTTRTKWQ